MNIYLIDAVRGINYAFLFVIAVSCFYQFVDEAPYISDLHRCIFIAYMSIFLLISKQKFVRLSPFFLTFLFLITVVVNQRLAVISIDTLYSERLYRLDISQALITEYILVFFGYLTILSLVVFWLGTLFKRLFSDNLLSNIKNRGLRIRVLSILFLFAAIWEIFNYANGGFLGGQSSVQNGILQRYVLSILKPDVFFYMALALLLSGSQGFRRRNFWISAGLIFCFLIWKTVSGGKDALLMLAIFYFSFCAFFRLDDKIRISVRQLMLISVLVFFALISFSYIDVFRIILWAGGSLADITDLFSRLESDQALRGLIGTLSNRLSIFDESLFSLYLYELGYSQIDHLVNFESTIKLVFDVIVPSTLYPELVRPQYALALSQGFDYEYNSTGLQVMTGFVWGYVGFFGFLFGKSLGALVAACWVLGGLLYFSFLAKYILPTTLAAYFLLYHIPVWLYLFLAMMGLEHSASWFVHIPLINIINYCLYSVLYSLVLGLRSSKLQ